MSATNKPSKYGSLEIIVICIALMVGCSTNLRREDGTAEVWQQRFEVGDVVRSGILLDFDGTRYMELILKYEHRAIHVVVFMDLPAFISIKLGPLSDRPGRGSIIVPSGSEATALAGALSRGLSKLGDNEANNVLILIEALSGRPIPQGRTWKFSRSSSSLDGGSKSPRE